MQVYLFFKFKLKEEKEMREYHNYIYYYIYYFYIRLIEKFSILVNKLHIIVNLK